METVSAMGAFDAALVPDIGNAAQVLRSEIRAFVLSKKGDPDFIVKLRSLVETDLRFETAIFEAPAALSGISPERQSTLGLRPAMCPCPRSCRTGSRGAGSCIA